MSLIVRAGLHGRGVFTDAAIPAGALLLAFTGPLLRYAETTPETLALQIGPDLYLGGSGGADDYVNHSCAPNSGLVIRGTEVKLIAIRDIAAGEELAFDYSTVMDEDDFEFDCACGEAGCRGRIRDFKHLPAELRQRYQALGVVPEHNLIYV
jgi:hypothetical protein